MVKTLIFGERSNLSKQLQHNIPNSEILASDDLLSGTISLKFYSNQELVIIINSFYPASKLDYFLDPLDYIEKSIYILSYILKQIRITLNLSNNIRKIIYTSSASVYGNNNYCSENDTYMPLNLHASLKISSEKLLEGFCNKLDIDYTIARIFNMYGGDDKFSIISKVIDYVATSKTIPLINQGSAIRDFIHVNDVVMCYKKLIVIKDCHIINVASGEGISIKIILDYLRIRGYSINIKNINKDEIKISTANVEKLKSLFETLEFINVTGFIESSLNKEIIK